MKELYRERDTIESEKVRQGRETEKRILREEVRSVGRAEKE